MEGLKDRDPPGPGNLSWTRLPSYDPEFTITSKPVKHTSGTDV